MKALATVDLSCLPELAATAIKKKKLRNHLLPLKLYVQHLLMRRKESKDLSI